MGLFGGLTVGPLLGLISGLVSGLLGGLFFGLTVGLIGGLMSGLGGWFWYLIATRELERRDLLPRDVVGLMNRAVEAGLMYPVGPGYRFIHRTLQEHLAVASTVQNHRNW